MKAKVKDMAQISESIKEWKPHSKNLKKKKKSIPNMIYHISEKDIASNTICC